jgi:hypothetical protein
VGKETGEVAIIFSSLGYGGGIAGCRNPFEEEYEGMERLERCERVCIERI